MATTRKRAIPFKGSGTAAWTTADLAVGTEGPPRITKGTATAQPSGPSGTQVTTSENHPGWRRRKPHQQVGDIGGNFLSTKQYATCSNASLSLGGSQLVGGFLNRTTNYRGFFLPMSTIPAWPPDASSSDGAMNAYGTKAVAGCKPTNALVDLSTALGELVKDGAPNKIGAELWKSTAARARNAIGSEYLNVEFGWKPLLDDVRKTAKAIADADNVMRQYQRDAGRLVRRRFDFPPVNSETTSVFLQGVNAFSGYDGSELRTASSNEGRVLRKRTTLVRRWFSGGFTYHLPYIGSGGPAVEKARHIYNLDLTPETLWNLAPWSWAIDWFAPVGDLIGNLQDWADDGLVLRYGYIMEHSYVRDTYIFDGKTGFKSRVEPSTITLTTEVKKRRRANPFGFGLTWSGLSPRQLAIAAALGLSKS